MTDPWCWYIYIYANIYWGYIDGIHGAPLISQHRFEIRHGTGTNPVAKDLNLNDSNPLPKSKA